MKNTSLKKKLLKVIGKSLFLCHIENLMLVLLKLYVREKLIIVLVNTYFKLFKYHFQIIVAQIDKKKNIWTRGMITNVDGHSSVPPKLYLIDSQVHILFVIYYNY